MTLSVHQYNVTPISSEAVGGHVKIPTDREFDQLFTNNYYPYLINAMRWHGMREKKTTAETKPIRIESPVDFPEQLFGHVFDTIELETTTDYQLNTPARTSFGMALTNSKTGRVVDVYTDDNDDNQVIYALPRGELGGMGSCITINPDDFSTMLANVIMDASNLQVIPFSNDDLDKLLSYLLELTSVHVEREANYSLARKLDTQGNLTSSMEQTFSFSETFFEYNKNNDPPKRRSRRKELDLTVGAEFNTLSTKLTQGYYYRSGKGRGKQRTGNLNFGVGINGVVNNESRTTGDAFDDLRKITLASLREYSDVRDATQWLTGAMELVIATANLSTEIKLLPYQNIK